MAFCDMYCSSSSTMDTINIESGTKTYNVELTDEQSLNNVNIVPGWSGYQSFTLKNSSTSTLSFDLVEKVTTFTQPII